MIKSIVSGNRVKRFLVMTCRAPVAQLTLVYIFMTRSTIFKCNPGKLLHERIIGERNPVTTLTFCHAVTALEWELGFIMIEETGRCK
jgi:hypothetical protein